MTVPERERGGGGGNKTDKRRGPHNLIRFAFGVPYPCHVKKDTRNPNLQKEKKKTPNHYPRHLHLFDYFFQRIDTANGALLLGRLGAHT